MTTRFEVKDAERRASAVLHQKIEEVSGQELICFVSYISFILDDMIQNTNWEQSSFLPEFGLTPVSVSCARMCWASLAWREIGALDLEIIKEKISNCFWSHQIINQNVET